MIKKLAIKLFGIFALLTITCHAHTVLLSGTINETNNSWGPSGSGALVAADKILLTDDILVPKGTTLTILPGTRIVAENLNNPTLSQHNLFAGIEISNYGKVIAKGTKENPILFQGAKELARTWQGFFSLGTLILENVGISDATCGVTASGGSLQITGCSFLRNETAIMLWGWQNTRIQQSLIKDNLDGISCASTPAIISENTIKDNQVGVRILQGESGPLITNNSFENNSQYHIFNLSVVDINAYPNTWDLEATSLLKKLYDGRVEPEAGVIIIDPECF
ncbi:MAG: right-handed parallel beta-helix repeat-containing protein [Firmicutes bacterium]|nr:right-handed parallel beta-helix repeat-containing protein [Bacillota bacterium]